MTAVPKEEKPAEVPAAAGAEDKKPEETKEAAAPVPDNILSMFGGGSKPKREEKEEEEEEPKKKEGEEEAPESPDVHFEPLVTLEKVEVKSNEESEEQVFKMRAKLFKFDRDSREWKERGTGDVRLLKHKENGKTRLVMRRDKTLKVCANHYSKFPNSFRRCRNIAKPQNLIKTAVVPDMKLSPNVGSDRSWVWNTSADVSEGDPEAQTLAIRFANPENANLFRDAFVKAQQENEALLTKS
ncbi:Ran GTPase binding protein Sbp1 [Rhizina undulata]